MNEEKKNMPLLIFAVSVKSDLFHRLIHEQIIMNQLRKNNLLFEQKHTELCMCCITPAVLL